MKAYIRPRPILHMMAGIGIGLLSFWLFGLSKETAFVLGIILFVSGVLGEYLTRKNNGENKR